MLSATGKPITLILSTSEIGAGKKGAGKGPVAVKDAVEDKDIRFDNITQVAVPHLKKQETEYKYAKHIGQLIDNMCALTEAVADTLNSGAFPLLFSGDHSNAIGGLSGLKNVMKDKRIGVIWVDAHADLHSPYTTPSGNIHGMPLAALLGLDHTDIGKNTVSEEEKQYWNTLKTLGEHQLTPKFNTNDLVFIDVRDAEREEWEVIRQKDIKVFKPEDIRQKGMNTILHETIEYLKDCDALYVSFDADSLDTSISFGTGTPVPNGLTLEQGKMVFRLLLNHPKTALFEITEVNPELDRDGNIMAEAIAALLYEGLLYGRN